MISKNINDINLYKFFWSGAGYKVLF